MKGRCKVKEIKFRGKVPITGKWVYGSLVIDNSGGRHAIIQQIDNPMSYECSSSWCLRVEPPTVGQFTGRVDKKGNEIYQGDRIRVDDVGVGGFPEDDSKAGDYVVMWSEVDCAFMLETLDGKNGVFFDECCEYEVIGNVYDKNCVACGSQTDGGDVCNECYLDKDKYPN